MWFTKLGHWCVRLEKEGAILVIDPVIWTDAAAALAGATAVMITHEHREHLHADAIRTALQRRPELTLWANPSVTTQFSEFGERVHETRHGAVSGDSYPGMAPFAWSRALKARSGARPVRRAHV